MPEKDPWTYEERIGIVIVYSDDQIKERKSELVDETINHIWDENDRQRVTLGPKYCSWAVNSVFKHQRNKKSIYQITKEQVAARVVELIEEAGFELETSKVVLGYI